MTAQESRFKDDDLLALGRDVAHKTPAPSTSALSCNVLESHVELPSPRPCGVVFSCCFILFCIFLHSIHSTIRLSCGY